MIDPDAPAAPSPPPSPPSGGGIAGVLAMLREVVLVLAIALGLSLLIKTLLVQAFFIPSESMENTLLRGDRVLVSKLTPGPFDLDRGDIVVFADPGGWLPPAEPPDDGPVRGALRAAMTFVGLLPADSGEHLIKRVVGLPGDTVVCCDEDDRITVNGTAIEESYLYPGVRPSDVDFNVQVPADALWVMGDHRSVSEDSRFHQEDPRGGTVPTSRVVGRAFVVVWPFDRAGLLNNPSAVFDRVPARAPR